MLDNDIPDIPKNTFSYHWKGKITENDLAFIKSLDKVKSANVNGLNIYIVTEGSTDLEQIQYKIREYEKLKKLPF